MKINPADKIPPSQDSEENVLIEGAKLIAPTNSLSDRWNKIFNRLFLTRSINC